MAFMTEEELEMMSMGWFKEIGYSFVHGLDLARNGKSPEREDFRKVILLERLRTAPLSRSSIIND